MLENMNEVYSFDVAKVIGVVISCDIYFGMKTLGELDVGIGSREW